MGPNIFYDIAARVVDPRQRWQRYRQGGGTQQSSDPGLYSERNITQVSDPKIYRARDNVTQGSDPEMYSARNITQVSVPEIYRARKNMTQVSDPEMYRERNATQAPYQSREQRYQEYLQSVSESIKAEAEADY